MRIYIAYKFVGENPKELGVTLTGIAKVLKEAGHEAYFALMDEELFIKKKFSLKQILNYALRELDSCDCILVFIRSNEKSEGMLIEVGYALANNKKIILAIKKGIHLPFTKDIANEIIEFENIEELNKKLMEIK
jgi:nucleoside 2-deoxyribosyltransferase